MSQPALSAFALLERIAAATTVDGAWQAYFEAARSYGFEHGLAFFAPMEGQLESNIFAQQMPVGFMPEYTRRSCDQSDPVARRIRRDQSPFLWDMETHLCETVGERTWRELSLDHGLRRGICIPDRSGGGLKAIGLCGSQLDLSSTDRMALHFTGIEALLRMRELGLKSQTPQMPNLSMRECECLKWASSGKSDWEIGAILSLSEKTVNVYIERAKHKLGGTTRVQAVVLALRNNIITL
jgi:LuxR family quorum sensing-dependent transcriptional regulator